MELQLNKLNALAESVGRSEMECWGLEKSYSHANMKEKMQWLKESLSAYRLAVCLLPSGLQLKKYFKFRYIIRLEELKWERDTDRKWNPSIFWKLFGIL